MQKLFVFCIIVVTAFAARADAPSVTCPLGFVMKSDDLTIATSCPLGYVGQSVVSCLVGSPGDCYMYVPEGVSYTEESGTYEYTAACAMTD